MLIAILRDGGATRLDREVASLDEAKALQSRGFAVRLVGDGGELLDLPDDTTPADEAPQATRPRKPTRRTAG